MNINKKFITAAILIVGISILMDRCKSPAPQEAATVTSSDTTIASRDTVSRIDTEKIVMIPLKDTVATQEPLTLVITNLTSDTAPVIVGVYGTKNKFPNPKDQFREYKFKPHGKQLIAKIANLNFDTYALAIYQDVNSNGKIDKNLIGIPTEPYAFSNNYKPTVKAPNFDDCRFCYDAKVNTISMNMIK